MPTPAERIRQLEDDARDLNNSLGTLEVQLLAVDDFRKSAEANQSRQATEIAVLKQRLDENAKRLERPEISIETLLKDVAALKTSNDSLLKRHEAWDNRFWGLAVAMVLTLLSTLGSLVTVIATVALRK